MRTAKLSVEVHCLQPRWVADEKSNYRIYVDGELLTERTWIWDKDTYIQEMLIVDVSKSETHTINIEVVKENPYYLTQLELKNLVIDDTSYSMDPNTCLTFTTG